MQTDMESDDDDDDDDDDGSGDGFYMTRLKRHPRDPFFIDKKAELLPHARHDPLSLYVSACTCAFYPLRCERLFHASVVDVVAATPFSLAIASFPSSGALPREALSCDNTPRSRCLLAISGPRARRCSNGSNN